MIYKNLDIIYNKNYLVIVPTMSKEYIKYLDYSFGNTILFDNLNDTQFLIDFINNNNFRQLIFVDFQLEYEDVLKKLNSNHEIKFLFTKSLGAFSNQFFYSIFKGVIDLYDKHLVRSIGFLDKNLYEIYDKKMNCFHITLDKQIDNSKCEVFDEEAIGILNSEENPNHSFYNELSAVKMVDYAAKLKTNSKVTREFLKLFDIKYKEFSSLDEVINNNLANLYVNFTDNNNMIFIESMDANVPCILGNNEILENNKFLKSMLVLNSDDDIDEISQKIKLVKKNRNKILDEYAKFRQIYSKKSKKSITDFLETSKEEVSTFETEKLLSVVVPVYNTEKYLENSLGSIIKALPLDIREESEILIINDGSTDESEKIALNYKKQYPNLIKYIKQKNHGLGNVRNVALKEAKGKYIASVDSDDTININFFKDAIEYMKKDIDIVIYDWQSITENDKFITSAIEWVFKDLNKYEGILYTTIMPSTCNKIIKKSLYDKLKIKFWEDKYEDLSTNPFILLEAGTIKYINKPYYEYFIRSNSIMRSSAGYSMIDVIKEVDNRLLKYKDLVNVDINKFKFYTYSWRIEEFIFNQLYTMDEKEIESFSNYIYKNIYNIISDNFNNTYYLEMLDSKVSEKQKEFILKRNDAFLNKKLKEFIIHSIKKDQFYKLTAPIIYFGSKSDNF